MESEQIIWLFLGGMFILVAIGLSAVKTNKEQLQSVAHSNPGMALFRFGLYRWGVVMVFGSVGLVLMLIGFGWLS